MLEDIYDISPRGDGCGEKGMQTFSSGAIDAWSLKARHISRYSGEAEANKQECWSSPNRQLPSLATKMASMLTLLWHTPTCRESSKHSNMEPKKN